MAIPLKSPPEIDAMRRSGALLWEILQSACEQVRPGITSLELDAHIDEAIRQAGAEPVMRGYRGQHGNAVPFPGSASICINEEVVHAVPGPRILREGDIVTIDSALHLNGWCADAAVGVLVGGAAPASGQRANLLGAARDVIAACMAAAAPGRCWSEVMHAGRSEADRHGFCLLADLAGHGIGRNLHELPTAAFASPEHPGAAAGLDFVLRPGMAFTIEPVLVPGRAGVLGLDDGWTVVTTDRSPAAHEERTVAVVRRGVSVLTA